MMRVLKWLIIIYLHMVYKTIRIRYENMENWQQAVNSNEPLITLFWHGRLIMIPLLDPLHRTPKGIISRHGDGELITQVMQHFGIGAVRGSSNRPASDPKGAKNRGGSAAIKAALSELKNDTIIGITPDGPRGPYHKIKPNIIGIAQQANAKVITVCFAAKWAIRFNSWDKFVLPLPFSKVVMQASPVITPTVLDLKQLETQMQQQQIELDATIA